LKTSFSSFIYHPPDRAWITTRAQMAEHVLAHSGG
jgi:hypothetical protein